MGEKPVFSTRAHVFQLDPQTKKNWKPASKTAIPVAFYHDSTRKTYRIISVDSGKPLVNSTITPNMNFTKTSPKFGQWTDVRVATIYGLGFSTETELNKFVAQFDDAKAATKAAVSESGASSMARQRVTASPTGSSSSSHSEQSESNSGMSNGTSSNDVGKSTSLEERPTANGPGIGPRKASISGPSGSLEGQLQALKYENDRLKIALATSSSHGKKWESEMQTLKNNNAKLTTALQESLSHVEEWKKQLRHYEEESGKLKQRVQELEAAQADAGSRTNDTTAALTEQIRGLEQKVEELQIDITNKDQEISRVSEQLDEMSVIKSENQTLSEQLNLLEEEKTQLADQLSDTQDRLQVASIAFDMRLQQLAEKHKEVGDRLREALNIHQLMEEDLK